MRGTCLALFLCLLSTAGYARVNATAYASCIPQTVDQQTSDDASVSATFVGGTGSAQAQAVPYSTIRASSSAENSGIGCLYSASGFERVFVQLSGAADGQVIPVHFAAPGTIALKAQSDIGVASIGYASGYVSVDTSRGRQTLSERLVIEDGLVSPLSSLTGTYNVGLTPRIRFESEAKTITLLDDDFIRYGVQIPVLEVEVTGTEELLSFSQGQATLLTALLAASELAQRGPFQLGFDYNVSSRSYFTGDFSLSGSGIDLLELNAIATSGSTVGEENTGSSQVILGNPLNPLSRYRFYVDDDYAGNIGGLSVRLGFGGSSTIIPLERRADVFGAVPEPSSWLMMVMGFFLFGHTCRRTSTDRFAVRRYREVVGPVAMPEGF